MVRTYQRKTNKANVEPENILAAVKKVLQTGSSIRSTANEFGLNYKSLGRYIQQVQDKNINEITVDDIKCGYQREYKLVFSSEDEEQLVKYILRSAEIFYGLTPAKIRTLAYQFAMTNYGEGSVPKSWISNEKAGEDWFSKFMKRHPVLSL